jgi:hypothetical protein
MRSLGVVEVEVAGSAGQDQLREFLRPAERFLLGPV